MVDGLSALLHLVRASLKDEENDLFARVSLWDQEAIQEAELGIVGKEAARDVLTNQANWELKLYQQPDEYYEEYATEWDGQEKAHEEKVGNEQMGDKEVDRKRSGEKKLTEKSKRTFYRFKDRVTRICAVLEQIIAHQSDVESENGIGFKVRKSPKRQLEGFHFRDVATGESPIWPRVTELASTGEGWVDFARATHAITLFGSGFGELLKSSDETPICAHWKSVPTGNDYLAVSVANLQQILEKDGNTDTQPWKLIDDICWYTKHPPFESCQCSGTAASTAGRCDRVQMLYSQGLLDCTLRNLKSPSHLEKDGAVIFGHSHKISSFLSSSGIREQTSATESTILATSHNDNGIGSSADSTSLGSTDLSPPSNPRLAGMVKRKLHQFGDTLNPHLGDKKKQKNSDQAS
jgi:hypothetical protein